MKERYKVWFVLTSINVSFLVSVFVYFLIWTIVMFASFNEGTSFPSYAFVPYLIALFLGLFPILYSLLFGFKKIFKKGAFQTARRTIFWLNISCLLYLGTLLFICFLFFFTNWNLLSFGVPTRNALLSYLLILIVCSIHPFVSSLVFRKE